MYKHDIKWDQLQIVYKASTAGLLGGIPLTPIQSIITCARNVYLSFENFPILVPNSQFLYSEREHTDMQGEATTAKLLKVIDSRAGADPVQDIGGNICTRYFCRKTKFLSVYIKHMQMHVTGSDPDTQLTV
jgi:hypothetical protein